MAINLVSTALQFLGPALIEKIAASLGLDKGLVGKAISAAVPAILSGLVGAASKPDGARSLAGILGKQDPGLLGKLGDMIGAPSRRPSSTRAPACSARCSAIRRWGRSRARSASTRASATAPRSR